MALFSSLPPLAVRSPSPSASFPGEEPEIFPFIYALTGRGLKIAPLFRFREKIRANRQPWRTPAT